MDNNQSASFLKKYENVVNVDEFIQNSSKEDIKEYIIDTLKVINELSSIMNKQTQTINEQTIKIIRLQKTIVKFTEVFDNDNH